MERITQVSDTVRVEAGPPIKRSLATENTLSNSVTASHYVEGGFDAFGKKIQMGKQFHYVDWKADEGEFVHTVYQIQDDEGAPVDAEFDDDGNRIGRYQIVVRCDNAENALDVARDL